MSLYTQEGLLDSIKALRFGDNDVRLLMSKLLLMNTRHLKFYMGTPRLTKSRLTNLLHCLRKKEAERQAAQSKPREPYQRPPRRSNRELLQQAGQQFKEPAPEKLFKGLQLADPRTVDGGMHMAHGMLGERQVLVKWADVGTPAGDLVEGEYDVLECEGPLVHLWGQCVPELLLGGYDTPHQIMCVTVTPIIEGCHPTKDSSDELLEVAVQGLQRIHEQGIAHRDICRDHIIIDGDKVFFVNWGKSMPNATEAECKDDMRKLHEVFGRPDSRGTSSSGCSENISL